MSERPAVVILWEDLPVAVQVIAAFTVSLVVLWIVHVTLLNQPSARGWLYALFWAVPATVVIVGATRTERARRLRAGGDGRTGPRR